MQLSKAQAVCLEEMGVVVWKKRSPRAATKTKDSSAWQQLEKTARSCQKCDLHQGRSQVVFGCGSQTARWLIIGEAPGAEEDKRGEPFVGRAGKLLDSMLQAIGLERKEVYIANLLKCRPPNNRDPTETEIATCNPYLRQQISLIQPTIILALGRFAAQNLLNVNTPIGKMRGQPFTLPNSEIPLIVTYHPAYLLRSPLRKRDVWGDLQLAQRVFHAAESPS